MRHLKTSIVLVAICALAAAAVAAATPRPMSHMSSSPKAVQLRIALNELLGEHAILAIQATQRGLVGGKDFAAVAKELDRNSVAISKAIGSVYGPAAAKQFLNGKNLWRAHIRDFVAYTVATAKHDPTARKKAVASLQAYIQTQATFFAKATGLPRGALVNDLTAHVLQLKGQLDDFAAGKYAQSYALTVGAYDHMGMTADLLASAIAKQQGLGSTTGPEANLQVALDRLLGLHALLATWATESGLRGDKSFPALASTLDKNSVAISKAIGSLYGAAAARQFLNGKDLWRDHIKDFVAYTVATAKHDPAAQKKAVTSLQAYIQTQAAFFAKAIGLPKVVLVNDLTAHVLQLKGVVDDYAAGRYPAGVALVHGSYGHMYMTGDVLAGGIAKQKGLR